MRRCVLPCVLSWAAALVVGAVEGCLGWLWLSRTLYVERYGALENPYAAEEAFAAGGLAMVLLPIFLLLLALAIYCTKQMKRKRRQSSEHEITLKTGY